MYAKYLVFMNLLEHCFQKKCDDFYLPPMLGELNPYTWGGAPMDCEVYDAFQPMSAALNTNREILQGTVQMLEYLEKTYGFEYPESKKLLSALPDDELNRLIRAGYESYERYKQKYKTYLVEACENQDVQLVEQLLNNGADPNERTDSGYPPLYATIRSNGKRDKRNIEIFRLLLDYGADVNTKIDSSTTLLEYVADEQLQDSYLTQAFKMLVEAGADIHRGRGGTVLFYLVPNDRLELADCLMTQRTIDVNKDIYGGQKNLLMEVIDWAKCYNKAPARDTVMWLIDHGIDLSHTDANGKTAYDYAVENGYTEIAQLIQDAMNQSAQH